MQKIWSMSEIRPVPFQPLLPGSDLKRSLEEIREMWMRLLIYAAGKCSGELHARHLGNGCDLLTFVWLLMLHHGLGNAATEVNLLIADDPGLPKLGSVVAAQGGNFGPRPEQPRYAFDFRAPSDAWCKMKASDTRGASFCHSIGRFENAS